MANLQQSIISVTTAFADPAASASEADMPKQWGLPDLTDAIGLYMPFAGAIVGISVQAPVGGSDTIKVSPRVGGTNAQMAGGVTCTNLAATCTNAAPQASAIVSKDDTTAQFAAGTFISLRYITTGYTPVDVIVTLYISTGREDI